jgi:hypothetical protein
MNLILSLLIILSLGFIAMNSGKTSIIRSHSSFFALFLSFPVCCHLVFSHVDVEKWLHRFISYGIFSVFCFPPVIAAAPTAPPAAGKSSFLTPRMFSF